MTAEHPGYTGLAVDGLRYLGEVLGLGDGFDAAAGECVGTLFGGWGHRVSRDTGGPGTRQDAVSTAPFEYSLVLDGDRVDVRIFFRPLAPRAPTSALGSWDCGWQTLAELERRGVARLERAREIAGLFQPRSEQAAFGMCLAASVRASGVASPKLYFDTLAAGTERSREIVGAALDQLGQGGTWTWLRRHDPQGMAHLMPAFFALDLDDSPNARIKFYTTVAERSTAELESRLTPLSRTAGSAAASLVADLAPEGSEALVVPGVRPTLCWSMTSRDEARPDDATLYLPFHLYAPELRDVVNHLGRVLTPGLQARVGRLVRDHAAAVEGRANPFHWVAARLAHGRRALTLYVSAAAVEAARTAHALSRC
ncbi:tryptophan dimethylallyltransferase family protein [Streptomyces sp. NPDC051567]|uniref:tryptophan dimethylallyltransferase family protein n=1 Tax=Streptomyces sp. NPDC051567 TaxID=3365660 RepID=UPI00378CA85A